jgi:3-dehydroquinate dehydratase / shikimate dehydrogenase
MIAVAFGPPTMAAALDGLAHIRAAADCVELRLDLFEEPFDLAALLRARGELSVGATLRPPHEGGRSPLEAEARRRVLLQAAELGAEYVDLEWDAATPEALAALHAAGAQVLVSRHDFTAMPAEFATTWWSQLAERGADVVKLVGTARDVRDCLPVFGALRGADRPTVAIAMGAAGLLSRILAVREPTCFLTYAMLGDATATAPGQVALRELHERYHVERLGPSTRAYGLLGPHAEPVRLDEYNTWFTEDGHDGIAVPVVCEPDAEAAAIVDAFRALPMAGWHIHGQELQSQVGQALDEIAPAACRQGKVNAVVARPDGGLVGHWVESPREQYALWTTGGA